MRAAAGVAAQVEGDHVLTMVDVQHIDLCSGINKIQVAALYVRTNGVYFGLDGVDPWDERRDARLYAGPHPIVAHPPCARWGRYWFGGPTARVRRVKGDDGGCFASAIAAVRIWGGVIEHPEASSAWPTFGLNKPPRSGGWITAGDGRGWTCCVEQGHYGHRARKATWLYACRVKHLPSLRWGKSDASVKIDLGCHTKEERRRKIRTGICQRMSHREREDTPPEFRDLLLSIARTAKRNCRSANE